MKKIVATILIALLAITCLMAFVGCNNDDHAEYGDTFVGAISKSTYESVEDAVKGFLEEEISGQAFTAEYVGYTKTANLSQSEIDKLAIEDKDKESIASVEKGEVEYQEQNLNQSVVRAQQSMNTLKRLIYVITYESGDYRFFSPSINIGETMSVSCFNTLFNYNNLINSTCTINQDYVDEDERFSMKLDRVVKFTDTYFYIIEKGEYYDNKSDYEMCRYYDNGNDYYYYKEGIYEDWDLVYSQEDYEEFYNQHLNNFEDFVWSYMFLNMIDHSIFEKSKTGYTVNMVRYFYFMIKIGMFPWLTEDYPLDDVVDGEIEVVIKKGKISEIIFNAPFLGTQMKIYDIGTTKIDLPNKNLFDQVK